MINDNPEFILIAKALKLKGQHTFDVDDKLVFTVCDGKDCYSFDLKSKRANIGITCKRCIGKRHDDKRYAKRKEAHKVIRVAADSDCPISALDDAERAQCIANLNIGRKIINKKLKRVKARLDKEEEKCKIKDSLLKHMEQAAKDLANNEEAQRSLEDRIFEELKILEAGGKYTKGEPFTRSDARRICDEIAMHCQNWVHVKRGKYSGELSPQRTRCCHAPAFEEPRRILSNA